MKKFFVLQFISLVVYVSSIILTLLKSEALIWKIILIIFYTLFVIVCFVNISYAKINYKVKILKQFIAANDIENFKISLNKFRADINHCGYSNVFKKDFSFEKLLSPFQYACYYGRKEIIQEMLLKKPQLNKSEPFSLYRPLELVVLKTEKATEDRRQIMELLILSGAEINFISKIDNILFGNGDRFVN